MQADKHIYTDVYALVDQGWSLDNALHEFARVRSDVVAHLQPRPRPAPAPRGDQSYSKGRGKGFYDLPAPPPARPRPAAQKQNPKGNPKGRGKKDKGKGKGSGKRPAPSLEGWDESWFREATVNGRSVTFCMRYNVGACTIRGCRFSHRCAVPKPDGSPCNGNHAAVDHGASGAPRT